MINEMTTVIQTGDRIITAAELIPLLTNYQMLSRLVSESIIDEAIQSIECTPEEIATACQQFAQQYQLNTEAERVDWLTRHQINREQFIAMATRGLRIKKFQQATWGNKVQSYFLDRQKQLDRVIYSIIWTKDIGIAQEVYFRVQEKEQTFAKLAREYSQGPEAELGGLVGPVELGTLPQPLQQALSQSKPEGVSFPIRMGEWMAVFRLENYISVKLDEKMHQRMLNELFSQWLQEQMQERGYKIEHVEKYWENAASM